MALPVTDPAAPAFVQHYVNLADARLGARTLACSDEFFAASERMLNPQPAVFVPGQYDTHGKWMDGWETRRRRGPGHDWCVLRLARPGQIYGLYLDTSHFTGNFPPAAAMDACTLGNGDPGADTDWQPLLAAVNLGGNRHHYFATDPARSYTHLRLKLLPDGGLARLRVYGQPEFDALATAADGLVDLIAALQGGHVIAANDQHFGPASQLLLPGRGSDMGDGWETRRRREPGNDWCLIALAKAGSISEIEVDTGHFKGNYPDRCSVQAASVAQSTTESLITQSMFWRDLLPPQSLQMDTQHYFRSELLAHAPISHIRFNIFPDGGVSRLRLRGRPA